MESAIPMLLFFGGLTLFGLLIIWASYQSRELERAAQEPADQGAPAEAPAPPFFAGAASAGERHAALDPAVLGRLEQFLLEQQGRATDFVDYPTVEMLFRRLETRFLPKLIDRLQDFLSQEQAAAGHFLLDPSIESLHRRGPVGLVA
ncbi:MAG: hypothetical protein H8E31_04815 [Planctomycetes bacterium]|nr:hypothetical protein [Planctomycetota bacterium]